MSPEPLGPVTSGPRLSLHRMATPTGLATDLPQGLTPWTGLSGAGLGEGWGGGGRVGWGWGGSTSSQQQGLAWGREAGHSEIVLLFPVLSGRPFSSVGAFF